MDGSHGAGSGDGSQQQGRKGRPLLAVATRHPELAVPGRRSRSRTREEDDEEELPEEPKSGDVRMPQAVERERVQATKDLVERELMKDIPAEALQHVKKHALELSTKIGNLQKTNARLTKAKQDLEALNAGRIPWGTRPVPMPYESPLLDVLRPETRTWSFSVEENVTVREAKKRIHCQYLKALKALDIQVAEAQRHELREYTKKSRFLSRCQDSRKKQEHLWQDLDLDLEDDFPSTVQGLSDSAFAARIESIYIKTVDQAAIAAHKKTQLDDLQNKKKEAQIQKLLQAKPEDLLNSVIDQRVNAQLQWRGKGRSESNLNMAAIFTEAQGLKPAQRDHCDKHVAAPPGKPGKGSSAVDPALPKGGGRFGSKAKGKDKTDRGSRSKGKGKGDSKGKGGKASGSGRGKGVFPYASGARGKKGKGKGDEHGAKGKDPKGKAKGRGRRRN